MAGPERRHECGLNLPQTITVFFSGVTVGLLIATVFIYLRIVGGA